MVGAAIVISAFDFTSEDVAAVAAVAAVVFAGVEVAVASNSKHFLIDSVFSCLFPSNSKETPRGVNPLTKPFTGTLMAPLACPLA